MNDNSINEIRFVNKVNSEQGKKFHWGVRYARVTQCIPLSSNEAVGRIQNGDGTHVDGACFTFAGQPGDFNLTYEAYDVDQTSEVTMLLNNTEVGNADKTANNRWSSVQNLTLPDALVSNTAVNMLAFVNTNNPPRDYFWGVRNVNSVPTSINTQPVAFNSGETKNNFTNDQPDSYKLLQNYPNPFNPTTTIRFALPISGKVKLTLYNLRGELIETLVNGEKSAGFYNIQVRADNLPSGVYFYRLETGAFTASRKMVLEK